MNENWRPIVGFEGLYEVSDDGRVRGLDRIDSRGQSVRGRVLRASAQRSGHLKVCLCLDGKQSTLRVHRLVLEAFRGPCPEGMEACHGDGDPTNNRLDNLRWGSRTENMLDRDKHGVLAVGERHGSAKLKEPDIRRIFQWRALGKTQQQIADGLGVARSNISRILSGKQWKHLEQSV